jgi:hypothetical protein
MLSEAVAELLQSVVSSHRDVMITFAVEVEAGAQHYQVPVIKPLDVRKTRDGHWVITGYNLRRLPDDASKVATTRELIRSYRVDRIVPHTLQFLYPSLPPDMLAHAASATSATESGEALEHDEIKKG